MLMCAEHMEVNVCQKLSKAHIGGAKGHIGAVYFAIVALEKREHMVHRGTHRNRCVPKKGTHWGTNVGPLIV